MRGSKANGKPLSRAVSRNRKYLRHEIRVKRGRKCESQNRSRDREGAVGR